MPNVAAVLLSAALVCGALSCAPAAPSSDTTNTANTTPLMTPADLNNLPSNPPDERITYGSDSSQYGELRLPTGAGPHPVVVLIHGGCFKSAYATPRDLAQMGDALKAKGIATWNVEYRRLGQPGGGWPETYLDVGRAIDQLRSIAQKYPLDLGRVVLVGHSAGGHLAMWSAARARVPANSPVHMANPLPVRGVVDLAGPVDMTVHIPEYDTLCRDSVITTLLGGTPSTMPERYAQVSPKALLPIGVPQLVVIGTFEEFVPRPIVESYVSAAVQAGDSARMLFLPKAGHFEIASASAFTWPKIESAIRAMLDGKLPPPE
jgi:acetyl esterase/lipase